jgi:hypothetical protein
MVAMQKFEEKETKIAEFMWEGCGGNFNQKLGRLQ